MVFIGRAAGVLVNLLSRGLAVVILREASGKRIAVRGALMRQRILSFVRPKLYVDGPRLGVVTTGAKKKRKGKSQPEHTESAGSHDIEKIATAPGEGRQ